jgi:hypothetical protein
VRTLHPDLGAGQTVLKILHHLGDRRFLRLAGYGHGTLGFLRVSIRDAARGVLDLRLRGFQCTLQVTRLDALVDGVRRG